MEKAIIDGKEVAIGVTPFHDMAKISGLDFMRGILAGKYGAPAIGATLGFRLYAVEEGSVTFTVVPGPQHMNPINVVHGGLAATVLDSALACAVQTICPIGYASTSVELKVNFVRPILPDTGRLFAKGVVVHPGRQLATSEARLTDENGKLYAHGTQTCSVFKLPE